jgi:hypothetical protein
MPEFVADFSQAIQFILVPRGIYNVHVANAEVARSNNGDPMLKVRFEIDEVVKLSEDAEYTPNQIVGQSLFSNLMLVGKGAGITQQAFDAMFGEAEEAPSDTNELVGAACGVKVTHRVWAVKDGGDGETRANISRYLPIQGRGGLNSVFS